MYATGIDTEYILYGKGENNKLPIRGNLLEIIQKSDKEELKMYYKCITTIRSYINTKKKIGANNLNVVSFCDIL